MSSEQSSENSTPRAMARLRGTIAEADAPDLVAQLAALETLPRGADCAEWTLHLPHAPVAEALASWRLGEPVGFASTSVECRDCRKRRRRNPCCAASLPAVHAVCAEALRAVAADAGIGVKAERVDRAWGGDGGQGGDGGGQGGHGGDGDQGGGPLGPPLRLGAAVTVRRTAGGEHGVRAAHERHSDSAVHSDAWDGTVLCFGLASTKLGTPIWPEATFPDAVRMFVSQSRTGRKFAQQLEAEGEGKDGFGPQRPWRPGTLVAMPACVAHSKPFAADPDPKTPRWFVRATVRVGVAGRRRVDEEGRTERLALALLVAEHVWGDAAFAGLARRWGEEEEEEEGDGEVGENDDRAATASSSAAAASPPRPPSTEQYLGEVDAEGLRHGRGRCEYLAYPGGVYEGEWRRGVRHGRGRMLGRDGRTYDGEWRDGVKDGAGTYTWANGDVYEGLFARGKPVDPAGMSAARTPPSG